MQSKLILKKLKSVFPQLCHGARKGENGRVAVIGGSFQFTGAPYYSAISALRVGGDLSHIFCSKFSSPAIKSYSPQIIVHPLFVSEQEIKYEEKQVSLLINQWGIKLKSWQKAIHSWVIGPGLGRDRYMQQFFPHLVKSLPNGCLAIFDADAIYYLCLNPHLFDELKRIKAILTPNHRQLTFLQKHFKIDVQDILKNHDSKQEIIQLPNSYSNPYFKLVIKDRHDIILGNDTSFILKTEGGKKRCGGMGDILGGVMSVCALWDYSYGPALASRIVKLATRTAYEKHGRGLTAPYVINQLTSIVKNIESEIL